MTSAENLLPLSRINFVTTRFKYVLDYLNNAQYPSIEWLDIGSNCGFGMELLNRPNLEVHAVDINVAALRHIPEHNPKIKRYQMDGRAIGFSANTFDVVTAFSVMEQLSDALPMLKEMRRVMKDCGTLFLATPNKMVNDGRPNSQINIREFTKEELIALLSEAGFVVDQQKGQGFFQNTPFHKLLRYLRSRKHLVDLFYHHAPLALINLIKDFYISAAQGTEIREPTAGETERMFFIQAHPVSQDV